MQCTYHEGCPDKQACKDSGVCQWEFERPLNDTTPSPQSVEMRKAIEAGRNAFLRSLAASGHAAAVMTVLPKDADVAMSAAILAYLRADPEWLYELAKIGAMEYERCPSPEPASAMLAAIRAMRRAEAEAVERV